MNAFLLPAHPGHRG